MKRQPYILIAEDDADDRFLLEAAFKENDLLVKLSFVVDGHQVFNYLDAISADGPLPDLIVLDMNMPVLNGPETLKQLRSVKRYRHIPVIIYSTSDHEKDKDQCLDGGAAKYLSKGSDFNMVRDSAKFLYEFATSEKNFA